MWKLMPIIVVLFGMTGIILAVLLDPVVILHQLMLTLIQILHSMLIIPMEQVIFNVQIPFLLSIMVFKLQALQITILATALMVHVMEVHL